MMKITKGKKSSAKLKSMGDDHEIFLSRITKSLYYSKLSMTDRLSFPVTEFAVELFTEVKSGHTLERLDMEEASRISRNACVSSCSLVLALLYLERLKDCNPEYLQRVAPSELFLISLMVASKFLHDDGEEDEVFNAEWAFSGDLSVSQINRLEKDFLTAIDWAVFVHHRDFWERLQRLEKDIAFKEAQRRGWFSYTELNYLMDTVQLSAVIQTVISVSSICLATYAAGVITLLGSALVASHLPGTLLTPGHLSHSSNNLEMQPISILETKSLTVDTASEDDFSANAVLTLLKCNESCVDCENLDKRNGTRNIGWEWWLSSIMTWLPKYSGLNSKLSSTTTGYDKLDQTNAFVTNSKLVYNVDLFMQDDNNLAVEINWKETLSSDLKFLLQDWKHYDSYIAELSLDCRH